MSNSEHYTSDKNSQSSDEHEIRSSEEKDALNEMLIEESKQELIKDLDSLE